MSKKKAKADKFKALRARAEAQLKKKITGLEKESAGDVKKILHELRVHQIELEMQNEELRQAQHELEKSRAKYADLYDFAPVGYFTFDKNGVITEVNLAGCQLLGVERAKLIKKPFSSFVSRERRDEFYLHRQDILRSQARQSCELTLIRKGWGEFEAQLESVPAADAKSEFSQCRTAVTDITERKRAEENVLDIAKFPEENPFPVLRISGDGVILYSNGPGEVLLESWKKSIGETVPVRWRKLVRDVFKTGRMRVEEVGLGARIISFVFAPIAEGGYVNIYGRDITERKRTEETLAITHERLVLAQQSAGAGIWNWDITTDKLDWSPELFGLFGLDPAKDEASFEVWRKVLHPENRQEAEERIKQAIQERTRLTNEYRVVLSSGEIRWINAIGDTVYDDKGKPLRMSGICIDITEQKEREEELQKYNRILKALGNSSQALMRAKVESQYLREVCEIIDRDCGYRMVWIGFTEDDEAKSVLPAAYAGFEKGYLETLKITWADTERGRGPTGTAIRTGKPCICKNMLTDPTFKPWREEALKRGYASSIALPLVEGEKAIGAINIYSQEPDPFSEDEVSLLTELTSDLSYGIMTVRVQAARAKAEKALHESNEELRRFNKAAVGREIRMIELKKEVNYFCGLTNQPPRYSLEFENENGKAKK